MSEASPDIFLSYNREDAAIAQTYRDAFEREGFDIWWDATLRSGEAYDEVTEGALRGAKAVVVLWSPRSVASRWVRAEATIAARNKTLMPVTIEPCERPVMFELTQTAELSHWRGEADDKAWLAFLDDVRRMIGPRGPKSTETGQQVAPAAPANGGGVSLVAVLPITHRAGDEDMEILAEDLTEDITRELARNRFFEVIAARTMAAWRGKPIDYQALGRQLDARYLIEGKLQLAGETVRLTLQVIDTGSARMVWSQRFVGKADDIATSPEAFPVSVAADLGEHILQIEASRAMAKPGPHSAWEHTLRAMSYATRLSNDGRRRTIEEARRAIAASPDLGFAHAVLATALGDQVYHHGQKLNDVSRSEIQAHIHRALQLEGDDPTVVSWLAGAYANLGDGETYLRLARRAVELEPDLPRSHHMLGEAFVELGRTADAIAAFEAMESRTAFHRFRYLALRYLGICYLLEGRAEEAEAALDRSLAHFPDFTTALKWKAIVAAGLGRRDTALATVRRLREVDPTMSIDQHVGEILHNRKLAERSADHIATLRRLWDDTGGDA